MTEHHQTQNEITTHDTRSRRLQTPPTPPAVQADFWDVPALRDVVKILFDAECQSDSSYQLLLKFCSMSFKPPNPFDKHRNEAAITKRWPKSDRKSQACWPRDGRCTPSTRSAWNTRAKPAACGCPKAGEPNSTSPISASISHFSVR